MDPTIKMYSVELVWVLWGQGVSNFSRVSQFASYLEIANPSDSASNHKSASITPSIRDKILRFSSAGQWGRSVWGSLQEEALAIFCVLTEIHCGNLLGLPPGPVSPSSNPG